MSKFKGSEQFKDKYAGNVRNLLTKYYFSGEEIKEYINNTVYVGFGVEQIERNVDIFTFKFYFKKQRYLKQFICDLKDKNRDNRFSINEHDQYYYVSGNWKSLGCKSFKIYKGLFKDTEDFFRENDLKFKHNICSYSGEDNIIYVEDENFFIDRVQNFNKGLDEYDSFMNEMFYEDSAIVLY